MSDLIVIGISGLARSGKDTIANHLVHAAGFTRIALADGVRSSLDDIDGPTWQIRKELDKHQKGFRWPQQTMGGDCREGFDQSLSETYINDAFIKIRYLAKFHPVPRSRFVIPDVRHPYEPDRLRILAHWLGGEFECWKVERPGAGLEGDAANHASETSVADVKADKTFQNNLDIGCLLGSVDIVLDRILNRFALPTTKT